MKTPAKRAPRIGDGKFSFIPADTDHNGWLLLGPTVRMVGKVQYAKLFAILGTAYGGTDQSTTFGLPPAGDRFLLSAGQAHQVGSLGGTETVTLTPAQMPKHKHTVPKVDAKDTASQGALLTSVLGVALGQITKPPTVTVSGSADTSEVGGGEAHPNMPPFLVVNVFTSQVCRSAPDIRLARAMSLQHYR